MTRPAKRRRMYRECISPGCGELAVVYRGTQELWCAAHRDAFMASIPEPSAERVADLFERVKANREGQIADGETRQMRSR